MSDKVDKFMGLLGSVWGKRHESEEAEATWLRAWATMLKPFEPWVLEAGAQRILESRKDQYFPKPGEVRELLVAIRAEEQRSRPQLKVDHTDQHGDPYALADALIRCDLGRQAAAAEPCWILALHDFCRTNRRLPTGHEINRCKQVAVDFEQRYRDCVTGNAGAFSKPLLAWAETIIRKREDLRARLLGREAA
jgi:hypothetical protein